MSRRSKRRHWQQSQNSRVAQSHPTKAGVQDAQGGSRRRTKAGLLVGGLVVVVVAVLFAVTGGLGGRAERGVGATANASPFTMLTGQAPGQSSLSATRLAASASGVGGPKIAFATPVYDFGKIKSGDVVKYTYVFTNVGGATLQVSNVQVSCGCTTAGEWTRRVAPGETGRIPVEFNSANFGGDVAKAISVICNDTNQPTVVLQIKGNIWKAIEVMPQFAMFNVNSESPSNATTVRIVSNEEGPLTIGAPECSNPAFGAELRTNQPGKEFLLVVRTVAPLTAGSVQGQITLKTSSTNMPVINVSAWANVQPVVAVVPTVVALPAAPLTNPTPAILSIQNYGTNSLTLSEPAVSAEGVDVRLSEIQTGRGFTLTLNFPVGFEITQDRRVEVSMKSNHPQFPVIKVPVVQAPRAAPATVVPGAAGSGT